MAGIRMPLGAGLVASLAAAVMGLGPLEADPVHRAAIHLSPEGLLLTDVQVDGETVGALIDSGSSRMIQLSSTLAHRLRIPLAEAAARGRRNDGATVAITTGRLHTLTIGSYTEADLPVEVIEGDIARLAPAVQTRFEVIVGWGFLSRFYTVLDYARGRWEFSEPAAGHGRGRVALTYTAVHRVPVVGVEIDGRVEAFLVDTGAPISKIDARFAGAPPGTAPLHPFLMDGTTFALGLRVSDLSELKRSLGCVGVLGNDFLRAYIVSIDPPRRVISLD